jgi:hypothetical protein
MDEFDTVNWLPADKDLLLHLEQEMSRLLD